MTRSNAASINNCCIVTLQFRRFLITFSSATNNGSKFISFRPVRATKYGVTARLAVVAVHRLRRRSEFTFCRRNRTFAVKRITKEVLLFPQYSARSVRNLTDIQSHSRQRMTFVLWIAPFTQVEHPRRQLLIRAYYFRLFPRLPRYTVAAHVVQPRQSDVLVFSYRIESRYYTVRNSESEYQATKEGCEKLLKVSRDQ